MHTRILEVISSPRLGFLEKEGHLKYTFADALAAVADALATVQLCPSRSADDALAAGL